EIIVKEKQGGEGRICFTCPESEPQSRLPGCPTCRCTSWAGRSTGRRCSRPPHSNQGGENFGSSGLRFCQFRGSCRSQGRPRYLCPSPPVAVEELKSRWPAAMSGTGITCSNGM